MEPSVINSIIPVIIHIIYAGINKLIKWCNISENTKNKDVVIIVNARTILETEVWSILVLNAVDKTLYNVTNLSNI